MQAVRHRCHLDRTIAHLKSRGLNPAHLLATTGFDKAELRSSKYLPLEPLLDLQERAAIELGDPLFGLEYGLGLNTQKMALLEFLVLHSSTLRAAFETMARFFRLHQIGSEVRIVESRRTSQLIYDLRPRTLLSYRHDVAFTLGLGLRLIRLLTEESHDARLTLPWSRLTERSQYEVCCQAEVQLGTPTASIVVPREIMNIPLIKADSALFEILTAYAETKIAKVEPDPLLASVKSVAGRALLQSARAVTLDAVACSLHIGQRTLQRKLRSRGTSFRVVVDEVRHSLALDYLRKASTPSDVSTALGFSELSAFDRAFRRWTGQSPSEYQQQTLRSPSPEKAASSQSSNPKPSATPRIDASSQQVGAFGQPRVSGPVVPSKGITAPLAQRGGPDADESTNDKGAGRPFIGNHSLGNGFGPSSGGI